MVACLTVFSVDVYDVALNCAALIFDGIIAVAAERVILDVDYCSLRIDGPVCSNCAAFRTCCSGSGALAVCAVLQLLRSVESDLASYAFAVGLGCGCVCSLGLRCGGC